VECRRSLFTKKGRQPESLPFTPDALKQHSLRAGFQGSLVWGLCLQPIQDLPDPSARGWKRNSNGWGPVRTTIPVVQASLALLISCGCKKGCTTRCKCRKACLPCTELRQCSGDCEYDEEVKAKYPKFFFIIKLISSTPLKYSYQKSKLTW